MEQNVPGEARWKQAEALVTQLLEYCADKSVSREERVMRFQDVAEFCNLFAQKLMAGEEAPAVEVGQDCGFEGEDGG